MSMAFSESIQDSKFEIGIAGQVYTKWRETRKRQRGA